MFLNVKMYLLELLGKLLPSKKFLINPPTKPNQKTTTKKPKQTKPPNISTESGSNLNYQT